MTVGNLLMKLQGYLISTEGRTVYATNSELRRWCERGSVIVNGKAVKWDDELGNIESLVLHPKGKRKTTFR